MKKSKAKKIILVLLIVLILVCGGGMGATVYLMHQNFTRGNYPENRTNTAYNWYNRFEGEYPREAVEFPSEGLTLKGYLYGMEHTEKLLVFAHGIGSGHEAYCNILTWFVDHGWRVFAYDACGSGDSPGESTKGLVQSALDLHNALTFAETDARLKDMPKAVLGHSWGGYAAAAVLQFDHDIEASVSISGYAYPLEMIDLGAVSAVGEVGATIFHPFVWIYNKFTFGKNAGLNAVDAINGSDTPIMVMHGERDAFVETDRVGIISKKLGGNAVCVPITGENSHHNDFFYSDHCNETVTAWANGEGNCAELTHEQQISRYAAAHDNDEARAMYREHNEPLLSSINDFYSQYFP